MFETILDRTHGADTSAPTPSVRLPTLQENGDLESFITSLNTILKVAKVPRRRWKSELVSHISVEALARVSDTLEDESSTYEQVIGALRGSMTMSFGSAAEDFFSGEKGAIWELGIRSSISKLKHLVLTMANDANSMEDVAEAVAIAAARDHLTPALKTIIDTGMHYSHKPFVEACEQWVKSQPRGTSCFRRPRLTNAVSGKTSTNLPFNKRGVTCYSCGKSGHMSKECRFRPPGVEAVTAPVATAARHQTVLRDPKVTGG